jgi:hypothetical protein
MAKVAAVTSEQRGLSEQRTMAAAADVHRRRARHVPTKSGRTAREQDRSTNDCVCQQQQQQASVCRVKIRTRIVVDCEY